MGIFQHRLCTRIEEDDTGSRSALLCMQQTLCRRSSRFERLHFPKRLYMRIPTHESDFRFFRASCMRSPMRSVEHAGRRIRDVCEEGYG